MFSVVILSVSVIFWLVKYYAVSAIYSPSSVALGLSPSSAPDASSATRLNDDYTYAGSTFNPLLGMLIYPMPQLYTVSVFLYLNSGGTIFVSCLIRRSGRIWFVFCPIVDDRLLFRGVTT